MPQWPGDPVFESWLESAISAGADADVTAMRLCAHTGTHIDAPSHYISGGATADQLPLDALIGPAHVVATAGGNVTAADVPATAQRILFRTRNSDAEWWCEPYRPEAAELTECAAKALAASGARAVGIDYLSIGSAEVHRILLAAGIVVIEGLSLKHVDPGEYQLICLPMRIEGAEAAPARVLLRKESR